MINDLDDRIVEITATQQNIEKRMKWNEASLRDLWDNIKCTNNHIIGAPEEEREKGPEKIFEEIIAENFPNMEKEIVNQVQEAQRLLGRINPRRNTPRHIVNTLTKIKDRDKTLKATREKWQHTRELPSGYQLISQQKLYKPEGKGMIYLKWWKRRNYSQDYANSARFSFRYDREIKSFADKQKLGEFSTSKLAVQ